MVEPEGKPTDEVDEAAVLEMAITRAHTLLDGQLRDNDALDMKSQGVIALVVATIGVLIAVHGDINSLWWIPAVALGVVGSLLLVATWPRGYDVGPNPGLFYSDFGLGSALEARRQMLAELLGSVSNNEPVLEGKVSLLNWAFAIFGFSLIGAVLVSLIR